MKTPLPVASGAADRAGDRRLWLLVVLAFVVLEHDGRSRELDAALDHESPPGVAARGERTPRRATTVAVAVPEPARPLTEQLGQLVKSSAEFGAATGTFTPGTRRLAFGLTTSSGAFIYAPTAVYIAKTASSPAQGPYLAPADPMSVLAQYRSKENSGPGGIKAIYAAQLPIPGTGTYTVLSLTKTSKGLIGAPGEIAVTKTSPIPNVGQRPPDIATDTAATVGGNTALLTTRQPPEQMHSVSFNTVLGKRPIALLFSTPEFCVSRVCGPVTDVAVQLQHQFGNKITFIHEEVYADNQPSKGLRSQLKAFHLRTEPWLFAINRRGIIIARLRGCSGPPNWRRRCGQPCDERQPAPDGASRRHRRAGSCRSRGRGRGLRGLELGRWRHGAERRPGASVHARAVCADRRVRADIR